MFRLPTTFDGKKLPRRNAKNWDKDLLNKSLITKHGIPDPFAFQERLRRTPFRVNTRKSMSDKSFWDNYLAYFYPDDTNFMHHHPSAVRKMKKSRQSLANRWWDRNIAGAQNSIVAKLNTGRKLDARQKRILRAANVLTSQPFKEPIGQIYRMDRGKEYKAGDIIPIKYPLSFAKNPIYSATEIDHTLRRYGILSTKDPDYNQNEGLEHPSAQEYLYGKNRFHIIDTDDNAKGLITRAKTESEGLLGPGQQLEVINTWDNVDWGPGLDRKENRGEKKPGHPFSFAVRNRIYPFMDTRDHEEILNDPNSFHNRRVGGQRGIPGPWSYYNEPIVHDHVVHSRLVPRKKLFRGVKL